MCVNECTQSRKPEDWLKHPRAGDVGSCEPFAESARSPPLILCKSSMCSLPLKHLFSTLSLNPHLLLHLLALPLTSTKYIFFIVIPLHEYLCVCDEDACWHVCGYMYLCVHARVEAWCWPRVSFLIALRFVCWGKVSGSTQSLLITASLASWLALGALSLPHLPSFYAGVGDLSPCLCACGTSSLSTERVSQLHFLFACLLSSHRS